MTNFEGGPNFREGEQVESDLGPEDERRVDFGRFLAEWREKRGGHSRFHDRPIPNQAVGDGVKETTFVVNVPDRDSDLAGEEEGDGEERQRECDMAELEAHNARLVGPDAEMRERVGVTLDSALERAVTAGGAGDGHLAERVWEAVNQVVDGVTAAAGPAGLSWPSAWRFFRSSRPR